MDLNITAICEEQKRLETESKLLDDGSGGSHAEDTEDVALHLMNISDDGDGTAGQPSQGASGRIPPSAGTVPDSYKTGSANTDKVGTAPVTDVSANSDKLLASLDSASANTDKVGTGPIKLATSANPVDPATLAGVGTSSGPVCVDANTKMVGTNYPTGSEGANANTEKVGTGANLPCKRGTMPPPNDGTYLAVNLYKRKASVAPNLLGGAPCNPASSGSLYNGEASRIQHCHTSFNFPTKMNVMSSFDINKMRCSCCTEHWRILEKRVEARHVERRTFVLTDQHFVATAPAVTPGKQCLKIIRIENATLWELYNFF